MSAMRPKGQVIRRWSPCELMLAHGVGAPDVLVVRSQRDALDGHCR